MSTPSAPEESKTDISLTPSVREFVLASNNHSCKKCGATDKEAQLEIHHIKPKSEGGSNHPSNLTVYCKSCHQKHHNNLRKDEHQEEDSVYSRLKKSTEAPDVDPVPADRHIIAAVETIGPATTGQIADEADVTSEYARRRLYALGSAKIVAKTEDGEWNLIEQVENPVSGKLPDNPEQAARFARDDIMRRMRDNGMAYGEIAEIVGLDKRTVPTAINRAKAFDPPIPPINEDKEFDSEDMYRQVMTLARRVEDLESHIKIETED